MRIRGEAGITVDKSKPSFGSAATLAVTAEYSIRKSVIAWVVTENKGATYHGIGAGIAQIVQAIRDDERRVLTVSNLTNGVEAFKGICLSLPRVVGLKGVLTELRPDLLIEDHLLLQKSADVLKEAAVSLKMT
jgi:L-lactate dehydrogenase